MNKPTLYISCGIPGSGKTTFLKANKREDEIIISRDEVRYEVLKDNEEYFSHEKEIYKTFVIRIGENLKEGKNVYADATHLNFHSREKLLNTLDFYFPSLDYNIEMIFFNVPYSICLERNNKRTGRAKVPEHAILNMTNALEKPYKENYIKHLWIVDKDSNVLKEW